MMLIKLGGSAITDKSIPLTPRTDDIKRLAREIARVPGDKIVVHGAGSFGHIRAAEFRLKDGFIDESQREGICIVQRDVRQLNMMVVEAMREAGVAVASVPAGAITLFDNGRMVKFPSDVFSHYVKLGITPITFGDVVVDKTKGMAICSGDDIMLRLAGDLNAKKSFFVTSVDGIFASYPPEENEKPLATVNTNKKIVFNSRDVDVTGSMERKLALMAKMAALGGKVFIVNGLVPRRLASALEGKEFLGTEVII